MFDRKAWWKQYREKNRDKIREYDRVHYLSRSADPNYGDYQRNKVLQHRYGISLEQKREMYKAQNGLCKLCGERLPEDFRKANVDHNHETEQVRGLVHWSCNKLTGFVENNLDLIEAVYVHLKIRSKN